jgi:DNA-binding MarR family transcriptional regulator
LAERRLAGSNVGPGEGVLTRRSLGFLLAKAGQRWNEILYERFAAAGFPEVRPSYGSILIPLYEEDGLRMGEIASRARLSKQTITTMVRLAERDGLVHRRPDPADGRASRIFLTARAQAFRQVAGDTLAELELAVAATLAGRRLEALKETLALLADLDARD